MGLLSFDIKQTLRGLLRNSRYVLTLALVSALTLASVAVLLVQVYSVQYTQLPAERNGKVVGVRSGTNAGGMLEVYELDRYAQGQDYFQILTPYISRQVTLTQDAGAISVAAAAVRSEFFQIFSLPPVHGRALYPDDSLEGAPRVAIISYRLWMTEFQGRSDVIGETFTMDMRPVEIVGVMPEAFHYPQAQDLWINLKGDQEKVGAGASALGIGLLNGSVLTAGDLLINIRRQLEAQHPQIYGEDEIFVERLVTLSAEGLSSRILFMSIIIVSVLLIGGLCMLNLMASQFFSRSQEWRVRAILGGSPTVLLVILLVEALVIFGLGFALAYLLFQGTMFAAADYLIIHNFYFQPFWWQANMSAPVAVLLVASILVLVSISILWFFISGRRLFYRSESQAEALKHRNLRVTRWSYAFLQISLTTFLLSFFLLAMTSYYQQISQDLGIDTDNILVAKIGSVAGSYHHFSPTELVSILESVSGVERVSFSDFMPGGTSFRVRQYTNLYSGAPQLGRPFLNQISVTPGFFEVLNIELVQGRLLGWSDYEQGMPLDMGLMDTKTSKQLSGGGTMLGERVSLRASVQGQDIPDDIVPIVGLVGDVDYGGAVMNNVIYTPLLPFVHQGGLLMQARTQRAPLGYVDELEAALKSYNVNFTLNEPRTVRHLMLERGHGSATLMLNFLPAVFLAVAMCAIGILDIAKNMAKNNRREIGICKAIGMPNDQVLFRYLRHGLICIGSGLTAGALAFLAVRPLLVDNLFEGVGHYSSALLAAVGLTALLCLIAMSVPLINTVKTRSIAELIRV